MNNLVNWYQVSEQLRELKAQELTLRKLVVEEYFTDLEEGVNKVEVPGNAELVATLPYNYSIDSDNLDAGLEHVPAAKRDKLVTWKPSLSIAAYRALTNKARTAFTAECVTIKPGTPSLVIKPIAS